MDGKRRYNANKNAEFCINIQIYRLTKYAFNGCGHPLPHLNAAVGICFNVALFGMHMRQIAIVAAHMRPNLFVP